MNPLDLLKAYRWWLAAALAGVLVLGAWRVHHLIDKGGYDRRASEQVLIDKAATDAQRKKEDKWQKDIDGVAHDTQAKINKLESNLATSRGAAASLHSAASRAAASASENTCPTATSPTAATPASVLADVLGKLDDRAGELAEVADRSRLAGSACESAYEALTTSR